MNRICTGAASLCLAAGLAAFLPVSCASAGQEEVVEGDAATETVEIEDYPSYFNKRIVEALERVRLRQYGDAVRCLALPYNHRGDTPLDYRHDAFIKEKHGEKVAATVEPALAAAKEYAAAYLDGEAAFQTLGDAFLAALREGRYEAAGRELQAVRRALVPMAEARNGLLRAGWTLEETFLRLRARGEVEDSSFLSYASKFILGTVRTGHTGAVGAMDAQWEDAVGSMLEPLYEAARAAGAAFAAAVTADGQPEPGEAAARAAWEAFRPLVPLVVQAEHLNELLDYRADAPQKAYYEARRTAADSLAALSGSFPALLDVRADAASLASAPLPAAPGAEDAAADIRAGRELPGAAYLGRAAGYAALATRAAAHRNAPPVAVLRNLPERVERWDGAAIPRWEDVREAYNAGWEAAYAGTDGAVRSLLADAEGMVLGGARLIHGEDVAAYQSFAGLVPEDPLQPQYPTRLLNTIGPFRRSLRADARALMAVPPYLEPSHPYFADTSRRLRDELDGILADMAGMEEGAARLVQKSRDNQRDAQAARNEVDQYYGQAVAAGEQDDQVLARQRLERANATYLRDIDILRLDADTQNETYARLAALRQDLADRQMPLLVREVRGYKNGAKRAYYAGRFEEAGNYIAQADAAREGWSAFMDVELEPDGELDRLRNLVNTALDIRSGRTLNPNSPLYPEMSQILSIASQYYAEARALIDAGREEAGRELLGQAKDKLNEFKIVFPRNQDANLLSMRIDQVLDRQQFDETFRARLEELQKVNYAARDSLAQVSYSDLLDLAAIDPGHPGLRALIEAVELDMGLRQKPVDNSAVIQAQQLAEQAAQALPAAGRDAVQLADVRSLAQQALALNPDEPLALQVLDEVALRTGAQAAIVLTPADEEKYQRAVTYLQNGDIVSAASVLQELLQVDGNRGSAKVLKLQNRIEGMVR